MDFLNYFIYDILILNIEIFLRIYLTKKGGILWTKK